VDIKEDPLKPIVPDGGGNIGEEEEEAEVATELDMPKIGAVLLEVCPNTKGNEVPLEDFEESKGEESI